MEEKLIERLEAAVVRLEALSGPAGVSREFPADIGGDAAKDPSILAFDDLISQYVDMVSAAAEKIGGRVLEVTKIIAEAFSVQRELLIKIKQTQKPDMAGLGEFLKPFNEVIMKANRMTEGRRSDFFNHLKAATDSLTALAWIAYTGKDCGKRKYGVMLFAHGYPALEFRTMKRPVQYSHVRSNQNKSMSAGAAIKSSGMSMPIAHVEESWQTAEFYSNKVLVEYKNKDPNHVEWTKALKELYLPGLRDYVKSHYPLGAVWNASGKKVSPAPAKAPTPGAPAPPPHPPASLLTSESSQPSSSRPKDGMAAVFQDISSGNITAGLRRVTADMKTKNRTDRSGVVPVTEGGTHASSSSSVPKTGPPKLELQMGRKWVVENQIGKKDLVIDNCDSKQTVYIYGCKDSVLQIQGKVNNITVDKCTKMGVVFKDLVAACELVNCNSVEVQCQGSAPTISVDNTAGCQLYLSKESLGTSITTAKATEINVLVPSDDSDGDWIEHALPQQFLNEFKDGRFETTPVSHSGG